MYLVLCTTIRLAVKRTLDDSLRTDGLNRAFLPGLKLVMYYPRDVIAQAEFALLKYV